MIWHNWMQYPVGPASVSCRKLIFGLCQDLSVTIQHESLPWVYRAQSQH
jgi:hypothetical protein